jgi:hypothetical protein
MVARYGLPLSESEASAFAILPDIIPEYRGLLGATCSALLDRGFKIELEGAILLEQLSEVGNKSRSLSL